MLNVFEQSWTLLISAIVTLLIVLMVRRIFPEKWHWWQLILPVLLVAAGLALDYLVQTDTEKINAVINVAVKAVEEEDPDAIEAILADNYRDSYHFTKRTLMTHCRARLSAPLVEKNIRRIVSIEVSPSPYQGRDSPPTATAIFTVRILFDKQSYVYQGFKTQMLVKMKLDLQKQHDTWLISRAELLEVDRQPANWQHIK